MMNSASLRDGNNTGNISQLVVDDNFPECNETVFADYPPTLLDFAAICVIIFAVIGVIGNFISIVALSRCKRLRNATTAFIVNLCVADLLFCCFSMPLSAITFYERSWNYGDVLCKIFALLRYSNGAVSLFSVIAITFNRYIHVVHPHVYRHLYSYRNMAVMIVIIWIVSLMLLLPSLLEVWGKLGYNLNVGTCTILKVNGKSPKNFLYIVAFGLPSIVFILCYTRIFWVVRKAAKRVRKNSRTNMHSHKAVSFSCRNGVILENYRHSELEKEINNEKQEKSELRVLKVMLVIFITFILCYFPVSFVKIFKMEYALPYMNTFSYLGVYFSNIINPVIYVVLSKEYRSAYKELFCQQPERKISCTENV